MNDFVERTATVIKTSYSTLAPHVLNYRGPWVRDWGHRSQLFKKTLETMQILDSPFRYDLEQKSYTWLKDTEEIASSEIVVLGHYRSDERAFVAGWAIPNSKEGGAWPKPILGLPDSYLGLEPQEAAIVAAEIANHFDDIEFIHPLQSKDSLLFFGFKNVSLLN